MCLALALPSAAAVEPGGPDGPLVRLVALDASDHAALSAGEVVSFSVDGSVSHETASLHIVRVEAPAAWVVAMYAQPDVAIETATALERGVLGRVPQVADMATLTIDDRDVDELRGCAPGRCNLKLDASWMRRFREQVDWKSRQAPSRAEELQRLILTSYVADYLQRGPAAMTRYHDKRYGLSVQDEFSDLLEATPFVCQLHVSLCDVLRNPRIELPGITRQVLWWKEDIGAKRNVTTVVEQLHLEEPAGGLLVVTKQLYANHYYESALAITRLTPTPDGQATWVVHLLRARIDSLRGWTLLRSRIHRGALNAVRERVGAFASRVESRWRPSAPAAAR